jgi:hypothetical protein
MSATQVRPQVAPTSVPTTTAPRTVPTTAGPRHPVWRHGLGAAVVAAAATTGLAALASDDGISFATEPGGPGIPPLGFAELTLLFSLIGVGLAAVLARTARTPRRTFVCTTLALTALSYVPDLTFGFDTPSAVVLITAHTLAAAIVVPTLAGRLARTR